MSANVIALDIETTGLEVEKGHKIIELAMISFDLSIGKPIAKYNQRIHPERSILAEAQAVHGISIHDLIGCPAFKDVAADVSAFLSKGDLLIGHNIVSFDAPFIAAELSQAGARLPTVELFDTMLEGRWATPHGKVPNLGELCYALEIPYDKSRAHGALYDTAICLKAFIKGVQLGAFKLPEFLRARIWKAPSIDA